MTPDANMLIKLRETLLDKGESGEHVTCPGGITVYPNQWLYALWGWCTIIGAILSFCVAGFCVRN